METISLLKDISKKEEGTLSASTLIPVDFTHGYCVGKTGCGKTTSFIYPNLLDRMQKGHGILVYDYKGKEHTAIKALAKRSNRLDDVIEIGKDWGESVDILHNFDYAQVYDFLESIYNMDEKNHYWETSSINYTFAVYKMQKEISNFINAAHALPGVTKKETSTILSTRSYDFIASATLEDIKKVFVDNDTIKKYTRGLRKLVPQSYNLLIELSEKIPEKELQTLVYFYLQLQEASEVCQESLKALNPQEQTVTSATVQTHILAISGPLNGISTIEYLNKASLDLYSALEDGKIVVINTQSIPDAYLSAFTQNFLSNLSRRVKRPSDTLRPISLFVDEVQRVVREKTNFAVDILREAKIELLIAFQNYELLIDKMGKNNFQALLKNFSYEYFYANDVSYRGKDISKLDTFEYISSGNSEVKKADALFLESNELFDAQIQYQRDNKVHELYNLPKKYENQIVENVIGSTIILRQRDGTINELDSIFYSQETISKIDKVLKELNKKSNYRTLDEIESEERFKELFDKV